jgi:hypothetical protein
VSFLRVHERGGRREVGEVGLMAVSRRTWPERTGGGWAAVVHGRGSDLARGTCGVQKAGCARLLGRRGRGEAWVSRWPASGATRAGEEREG